jgi:hypothetical protein
VLVGGVLFVPDAVPRRGRLAILGDGTERLEIVVSGAPYGVRKRLMPATLLPIPAALDWLSATRGDPRSNRSREVWASAATAGLGLLARGRLLPTVTTDGVDAWRLGPLDSSDVEWLQRLAKAFPPIAHALGVPGSRPMRVRSPESLVRGFWDAIADTLVRCPAAARAVVEPAFAAVEPTDVRHLTSAWRFGPSSATGCLSGRRQRVCGRRTLESTHSSKSSRPAAGVLGPPRRHDRRQRGNGHLLDR